MKRFASGLLGSLLAASILSPAAEGVRPDLSGIVLDGAGQPLSGASVFVYTAAPRVGVGTL